MTPLKLFILPVLILSFSAMSEVQFESVSKPLIPMERTELQLAIHNCRMPKEYIHSEMTEDQLCPVWIHAVKTVSLNLIDVTLNLEPIQRFIIDKVDGANSSTGYRLTANCQSGQLWFHQPGREAILCGTSNRGECKRDEDVTNNWLEVHLKPQCKLEAIRSEVFLVRELNEMRKAEQIEGYRIRVK